MTPDVLKSILAEAKAPRVADKPWAYWFSNANDPCLRALVYDARDADDGKPNVFAPKRLRDLFAADCGTAIGERLEGAARRLGYQTQLRHEFHTGAIRCSGHSDILAPKAWVVDIKLVGEKSWKRRPHEKHQWQANGYAVEADIPIAGLLYVRGATIFDAESPEVETDLICWPASLAMAQELCGVWEQVERHRVERTLPERVWGASPRRWPCGWCRHLERCGPTEDDNA